MLPLTAEKARVATIAARSRGSKSLEINAWKIIAARHVSAPISRWAGNFRIGTQLDSKNSMRWDHSPGSRATAVLAWGGGGGGGGSDEGYNPLDSVELAAVRLWPKFAPLSPVGRFKGIIGLGWNTFVAKGVAELGAAAVAAPACAA